MSTREASPEIVRRECARILHRSVFNTLEEAMRGVSVDFDCLRDGLVICVSHNGRRDGILIDRHHLSWSLDDIFRRHSMQDLIFGFWSAPASNVSQTIQ